MPDIVLTTFNARYAHAAFGLRYLMANLGPLQPRAEILEFDITKRPVDVLEKILSREPRIVGIGVYIWNVGPATELVALLKRVRPEIVVAVGGPEVSFETDQQEIARLADFVIAGEGDLAFSKLCESLLSGGRPLTKIIPGGQPNVDQLQLPYDLYNKEDIAHRVIYVESSRGCQFHCEFCLSSLDTSVRYFPLDPFLQAMQTLLDRGVRQFKFVDRTFNLNIRFASSILQFFLERYQPGIFIHFEVIPDRLPDSIRSLIAKFPSGALQFEIGIQTFNPEVCDLISRHQDYEKLVQNLRFLRQETQAHMHTDLIVGLPGETVASFANGFDTLVGLRPQEIQVGMLKRLRGTPIIRHDHEWRMVYSPHPPYEILQNQCIDFATMQRLRRFSRYWDLVANSGNFIETTPFIWGEKSPFDEFLNFSDWLFEQVGASHGISLSRLSELLFRYLTGEAGRSLEEVAKKLWRDYKRGGRSDVPAYLKDTAIGKQENMAVRIDRLPRQKRFAG